ncbi:MAG TPA: hypothetical protein VJX10_20690, partial [Pseudonocardiaceae bacterium]|nr:hypothetical protein [Pseudonocardiaceae bacterium]
MPPRLGKALVDHLGQDRLDPWHVQLCAALADGGPFGTGPAGDRGLDLGGGRVAADRDGWLGGELVTG